MEYKEILESARTCIGPYCKACPVCNGKACGNQVPGPGAKAPGNGFTRNYDAEDLRQHGHHLPERAGRHGC